MPPESEPFICPRHACVSCLKAPAVVSCKYCPLAWCARHRKTQVVGVKGVRFLDPSTRSADVPSSCAVIICQLCSGFLDRAVERGLLQPLPEDFGVTL